VIEVPTGRGDLPSPLTPSERDVALRAFEGASNRAIATARGTSERTIANQLKSIYRKLGVYSRAELAAVLAGAADTDEHGGTVA
jgi:DNA-binding NarL/FixJ family response regulator